MVSGSKDHIIQGFWANLSLMVTNEQNYSGLLRTMQCLVIHRSDFSGFCWPISRS